MAQDNPLSYQTTMPEYPDVSYQAWAKLYGNNDPSGLHNDRASHAINAWFKGNPDYKTWRTNELDQYNARMSAYNTWLSTGAGMKASAESGDYNPSYWQAGNASASPLNYEQVEPSSGLSEMAQGVSGIIQFVQALQGMKLASEQIAGQALKNQEQSIINEKLPAYLDARNRGQEFRSSIFGYQGDALSLKNSAQLYQIYKNRPELWRNGVFSPLGTMSYDLRDQEHSFGYQKAFQDIEFLRAGTKLRKEQAKMASWSAKDKKFYVTAIQQVYKDFLEQQLAFAKGQVSFQKTEQDLRRKAFNWKVGLDVANTAISAAKTVISAVKPFQFNSPGNSPSWGNMPFQDNSWSGSWDRDTGEWYNAW